MVGIGAAVAVTLLAALIWQTWPVPTDDPAEPAGVPTSATASAPVTASANVPEPPRRLAVEGVPVAGSGTATGASTDPALESTRADYEQKLTARPNDAGLLNKLGQLLERMDRTDEALSRFERAVTLVPLEPAYRLNLARAAGEIGQWDRAIDQYREALRLRPNDYDIVNTLALALQKKGDDQSAVTEFQKARRLNPAAPGTSLGLATSLEKAGRVDEAIQEFRRYLDIRPTPADADRVKAHLALLSRGRPLVK